MVTLAAGLRSVAEDLEWLGAVWAQEPETLSDADVRRGATTLRRLLIDAGQGAIMAAWRASGFDAQPIVYAPDLVELLKLTEAPVEHAVTVIAGGAPVNEVSFLAIGAHRIKHPKTGVPPDADEGFAVKTGVIARDLRGEATPGPYDEASNRPWRLLDFKDSPGAVRRGQLVSRADIIQTICKDAGGTHVDTIFNRSRKRTEGEALAAELHELVSADWRSGLNYELLSIGAALGRSDDLAKLAAHLRSEGG